MCDAFDDHKKIDHRKVWGAGFCAGVKATGHDPAQYLTKKKDSNMKAAKVDSIICNLTGVEKKVLEAMPISEWWTAQQVYSEVSRINGSVGQFPSVAHAINTLVQCGLVKSTSSDRYQACENVIELLKSHNDGIPRIADISPKKIQSVKKTPPPKSVEPNTTNPMDQLYEDLESARDMIGKLETDVLAIGDWMRERQEEYEKLNQLKALLSSIN